MENPPRTIPPLFLFLYHYTPSSQIIRFFRFYSILFFDFFRFRVALRRAKKKKKKDTVSYTFNYLDVLAKIQLDLTTVIDDVLTEDGLIYEDLGDNFRIRKCRSFIILVAF